MCISRLYQPYLLLSFEGNAPLSLEMGHFLRKIEVNLVDKDAVYVGGYLSLASDQEQIVDTVSLLLIPVTHQMKFAPRVPTDQSLITKAIHEKH